MNQLIGRRVHARGVNVLTLIVALTLLFGILSPLGGTDRAEATHFRSGHGSFVWAPAGGNAIDFKVQNSFRRDDYVCRDLATLAVTPCTGPDGRAGVGDIILETIGGTAFAAGDGYVTPRLYYRVDAIDVDRNWLFGFALDPAGLTATPRVASTTIRHTYAAPGTYTAFIDSCCRLSAPQHINNPNGNYRVETVVNVGSGNSSPFTVVPPIVTCDFNITCQFPILANDPDGDPLRFRLATSAESKLAQPLGAIVDPITGIYSVATGGLPVNPLGNTYYSTQVVVEDLDGSGNAKSKVAVDFFIQLTDSPSNPPTFPGHDPTTPTLVSAPPGTPISFVVTAHAGDPNEPVTLNVLNLPQGATMTPALPVTGTGQVSSTFSWTPPSQVSAMGIGTMLFAQSSTPPLSSHLVVFTATSAGTTTVLNYVIEVTNIPQPVTVAEKIAALKTTIGGYGLSAGDASRLTSPLDKVLAEFGTTGRLSHACKEIDKFTAQVARMGGAKKPTLDATRSAELSGAAAAIKEQMGCNLGASLTPQIQAQIDAIRAAGLRPPGHANKLANSLTQALRELAKYEHGKACDRMDHFLKELVKVAGHKNTTMTPQLVADLTSGVNGVRTALGCGGSPPPAT